jgi:hypothetical protein
MADTSQDHQGGCLCGAVRYTVRGAPVYSAHCHCRSCQKALGAGYATWSGFEPENFEVTKGELTICASSPGVRRGFCGQCGSSLTYAGDAWDTIAITAATLDDPAIAKPTRNVYLEHRLPWVTLDETLEKSQQFP